MTAEHALRQGATKVPILMYHHINETDDWFATPESVLNEQMAWLAENGYVAMLPRDLALAMSTGAALPDKPVMLTIDDGNLSDRIFAETLERYGFRGVFFWPDTSPLSEAEMIELAAHGEIGAHTSTHPYLTKLSRAEQEREITRNLHRLRAITGQPIRAFAYPYGDFNDASTEIVESLGFDLAFNAWGKPIEIDDIDRWHVPRFEIPHGITLDAFIARVEAWR